MSDDRADLIWDEYKYRHQHCWNTIFKLTLAVVAIAVLPFTQEKAVCALGGWILVLPALALALSSLGSVVVYRELRVLRAIRTRHRYTQGTTAELGRDWFTPLVMVYLVALSLAAALSLCVVGDWQAAVQASLQGECFQ